jgi:hypothetical protein
MKVVQLFGAIILAFIAIDYVDDGVRDIACGFRVTRANREAKAAE